MLADFLRISSAILAISNGIVVCIVWIFAANDHSDDTDSKGLYLCHGCFTIFHQNIPSNLESNSDPYPLLVAFGIIFGVFWIISGILGFFSKTKGLARVYFIASATTYIIFFSLFQIISQKISAYVQPFCNIPTKFYVTQSNYKECSNENNWWIQHQSDSIVEFWTSSFVAFALATYQLVASSYMCATTVKNECRDIPKENEVKIEAGSGTEAKEKGPSNR